MAETLTQAEIDALREAVRTGKVNENKPTNVDLPKKEIKVVSYDFRKPKLLSAEHLLNLQLLHQSFAKNLQGMLFSLFKSSGDVSVTAMDQVSYGEFMLSLESPTCLIGWSIGEDNGAFTMELTPPLGQVVLDLLLGGDGIGVANEPPREFSALEFDILQSWVDRVIDELKSSWSSIGDIQLSMIARGVEPEQVQIVPPDTPCLCVVLKLAINEASGRLHICYPFSTLQSVIQKAEIQAAKGDDGRHARIRKNALAAIEAVPVLADIELGRTWIPVNALESLQAGDILTLSQQAGDPLSMNIGNRKIGHVRIGTRRGKLAATVTQLAHTEVKHAKPAATQPKPAPQKPATT